MHPNKKPWVGQRFLRNRFCPAALITPYILPVFGQFRDIRLMFACKVRAEWTFLLKLQPAEFRPSSWTDKVTAV